MTGVQTCALPILATNRVFLSRDVVFHEHSFPFASVSTNIADPFVPTAVEASYPADVDGFVTPISIPDLASLDFDVVLSPSTIVQPIPSAIPSNATSSSPIQVPNSNATPVVLVPPIPLRKSTRDTSCLLARLCLYCCCSWCSL